MRGEWPSGFAADPHSRDAATVLAAARTLTPRAVRRLAEELGSARRCLRAVLAGRAGVAAQQECSRLEAAEIRRALAAHGARVVLPGDPEYLPDLLELADAPVALFVRGGYLLQLLPGVAVVGARRASVSGREIARRIGARLAEVGVTVVSGGAHGIDGAAHQGALEKGRTVVVLGSGLDVAYPAGHRGLFEDVIRTGGALISEYAPGVRAAPYHFPARNRLIGAIARAVVVVEGAEGSGTLITAEHALELGREVFAVPGPIASPLTWVPHQLIREGATLVRSADEVVEELGIDAEPSRLPIANLSDGERAVLEAVHGPALPEDLASGVGLPVPQIVGILMQLEVRGLVRSTGGRFERTGAGS